jgi:23S rRNA (uracil1939-C5)-methyltransferase
VKRNSRGRSSPLWGKDSLVIERMSQEGRGVATRHGKVVFVSGALAGEQVRAQCTSVRRDYDEADMLELVADTTPCAERVEPPCPLYRECGGCSLQHWLPQAQLQHKQANLMHTLRNISSAAQDPPIASQPNGFRHRLRLTVMRLADRRYALGLRRRRSHDAVAVRHCLVANNAVNALLRELPDMLQVLPELQGLREIEIDADSNSQLGLCFHFAAHPGEAILSALRVAMLRAPTLSGAVVALRVRLLTARKPHRDAGEDDNGSEPLDSGRDLLVEGELCLQSAAGADPRQTGASNLSLAYLPGDFTQTHWDVNAALVSRALTWLQPAPEEHALDLFCGIGNFSLPLARHAHTVHALEGDAGMTARVTANAQRNGLRNIRARTLNLLAQEIVLPPADIAIIDPPRAGAKAACEALARSKVKRLVYVSCHSATLARDAAILHNARFQLTRVAAVDMFAHTGHSEAIALFERK